MKTICWVVLGFVLFILLGGIIVNSQLVAEGFNSVQRGALTQAPKEKGRFVNTSPVSPNGLFKMLGVMSRYITEPQVDKVPEAQIPVVELNRSVLAALANDTIHVVKLGHSSVLMKVHGEYWLFDPVFCQRASPFSFVGPKRFHPSPISVDALPDIDKVFISHNHYDHLDKKAIKALAAKTARFYVPLGVDNSLVEWGVGHDRIASFDWWQEEITSVGMVAFTPSRHFSGRGLTDANTTLWGSWVVKASSGAVYFSGDSGYFDGFTTIGERYGPFDVTLIETGAYDKDWPDIHMLPEESVKAHIDLQGKVMIPVHNGTFDLAFHSWYEPMERAVASAQKSGVALSTPVFGDIVSLASPMREKRWWREVLE
ncbi:MBL fold metallo-hydrolase [Aestuariibacter sp. A3R04]|uniref:MBL fold metallo-hydrolase n=1 Tax=Aestuariibacter sp. A3R04 TaxID=2841571 RepID=UPI001C08E6D2|nr:MBL fold metallo-hydrolase [Aestuariibacter sp. A3R04]MBU3023879.1 MBL fold metallo-hydrolase [Aestuariibacter sp. A3R04]